MYVSIEVCTHAYKVLYFTYIACKYVCMRVCTYAYMYVYV